jgi:hypothetical protein
MRVNKVVRKQNIEHFFKMADFFRTSGVGGGSNKKLDSTRCSRAHQLIQQGIFQNGARRTRDPKYRALQNSSFLGRLVWREIQTRSWIQLGALMLIS